MVSSNAVSGQQRALVRVADAGTKRLIGLYLALRRPLVHPDKPAYGPKEFF